MGRSSWYLESFAEEESAGIRGWDAILHLGSWDGVGVSVRAQDQNPRIGICPPWPPPEAEVRMFQNSFGVPIVDSWAFCTSFQ